MERDPQRPWTIVVAAVVSWPLFLLLGVLFIAKGEVEDFGDITGAGRYLLAIGAAELVLSVGVWFGSRIAWWASVILHGAVIAILVYGLFTRFGSLYLFLSCPITPIAATFALMLAAPSRRWCGPR